jgi:hypothetical protein
MRPCVIREVRGEVAGLLRKDHRGEEWTAALQSAARDWAASRAAPAVKVVGDGTAGECRHRPGADSNPTHVSSLQRWTGRIA